MSTTPIGKVLIAFEASKALRQRLRDVAAERDMSVSAVIRKALQQHLESAHGDQTSDCPSARND